MKQNIYQKLHKAACEASGVVKGKISSRDALQSFTA
jgi:hypothetical protein